MKIDLEIGDTILTGRFKNKPVEVKNIGTDDKGQPTINGRPALKFRIKKLMSKQEEQIRGIVREEIFNYIINKTNLKEAVIWKDFNKYPIRKPPTGFAQKAKMGAMIHFTGPKSGAQGETWSKVYQDEWMAIHGAGVKGDVLSSRDLDKTLKSHGRVQIKESGILYKAGVKKYGKEGMKKIQSAAGKGENHEEIGKIKDKYEKGKNETVDEKKKLLNDKLSKSQMAFMQKQLKLNRGDIITYDRFFKFGKVARDEKAKVVAVNGYNVQLDNGNTLDLRSFPIKKVNNKVYDRDLSMYDDILMR